MDNDRELLELAARATGLKLHDQFCADHWSNIHGGGLVVFNDKGGDQVWNPRIDDGDAFRLWVKLRHEGKLDEDIGMTVFNNVSKDELPNDICAHVRLAIVRAAAELGRAKGE